MDIKITKTQHSKLEDIDFDDIPFGKNTSDHMFVMEYADGAWGNFRIIPYQGFVLDPQSKALQYCQCIFEGMKATMGIDGVPKLLRPDLNIERFNLSAERMCMPSVSQDVFLKALKAIIATEIKWIPKAEGSALYLRPTMIATESSLAVTPSDTYTFYIYTSPVQPYFTKPVRLVTEQTLIRAVPGGTGEAKTGGNYAGSLKASELAKQKGFDQIVWLESPEFKKVQEAGMMNLFFVIGDTVLTPKLSGAVLKGTNRTYFIDILKEKNIKVEIRDIYIDEIIAAHEKGELKEAFGSGTAAVVSHISEITHDDTLMVLPNVEEREISNMLFKEINGLRAGTIADKRNWLVPVEVFEEIN
ncbi:MAG: branched-chain amino acid aminotransferase [Bacteroidetes bacterium]|nr:branched-chain amino acid aminotransferase [Bacteroidota bacterium]MBU1373008.1 branched-chain amino acid aminotransferase [Bacteroidota bacterium]MBU1485451.1 branched-chain amino acid aminotransferase [Bacteroidota bacterium]MBU1760488.1 branched-chain amino acid aminotransferase [Bacteroidota bacterium]MBU2046205.1 branched-chain amino acid aminotransferase [Bacteroidota bacterium]